MGSILGWVVPKITDALLLCTEENNKKKQFWLLLLFKPILNIWIGLHSNNCRLVVLFLALKPHQYFLGQKKLSSS